MMKPGNVVDKDFYTSQEKKDLKHNMPVEFIFYLIIISNEIFVFNLKF